MNDNNYNPDSCGSVFGKILEKLDNLEKTADRQTGKLDAIEVQTTRTNGLHFFKFKAGDFYFFML